MHDFITKPVSKSTIEAALIRFKQHFEAV